MLSRRRSRAGALLLVAAALTAFSWASLGAAFRDNDQAALISGALQVLRGQAPLLHAPFYNYDKQWGSYALLTAASRIAPRADPVERGNTLQIALLLPAILAALAAIARRTRAPVWTALPIFLSPALALYLPFLATASLSLAFLFLAYALLRFRWRMPALIAIAVAAACRGDVVLVVPVIVLSTLPRRSVARLFRSPVAWLAGIAAVTPVLVGKAISSRAFSDLAGFSFSLPLVAGFLTFALGLGAVLLLAVVAFTRLQAVAQRPRWRWFYALELLALAIPIAFYWSQLYSPRYFFLTLAALLFIAANRRTAVLLRGVPRLVPATVFALTLAPWLIGLHLPDRRHAALTFTTPTPFPTADGLFPMGAYGAFAVSAIRAHLAIDHNQKIWLSARSIPYRVCNGSVPVMATPMSYYLDVAIRLQNKIPFRVVDLAAAPCGGAYADLRAIVRHDSPGMDDPRANMDVVSTQPDLGRPIVWMTLRQQPSPDSLAFRELARYLGGKDAEVFPRPFHSTQQAGLQTVFLSAAGDCRSRIPATAHLCGAAEPTETGWAHTVFPDYMNK